jgi:hypothetical protein
MVKDLIIEIEKKQIEFGTSLAGRVEINYAGRFDSLVINSQIENTSDHFIYTNLDGRAIDHPYARISLMKHEIPDSGIVKFEMRTTHSPAEAISNAKVRVTLIQEHKEIASDTVHLEILGNLDPN